MIRAAVIAGVTAALLGLAFFGGHLSGAAKERAHWLGIENSTLREQAKEITRQTETLIAKQKEYNDAQIQINDFAVRLRAADRLRVKAEHQAAVERASAGNLRTYANGVHGLFETCRKEYIELGLDAAKAASRPK